MLSLQWPWLMLLLPLPWLLRWILAARRWHPAAVKVPFYRSVSSPHGTSVQLQLPWRAALATLMWLFLLAAAARPVWFGDPVNIATNGRDLMLALDISDSMRVEDMQVDEQFVTRIAAIKRVASEFIEQRHGDRIGLILFGQRSYLLSPLTFDRQSVIVHLQEALAGFAGSSTAIGDTIGMAIGLLRDRPVAGRVLILITDGSNTFGSEPDAAMKIAAEADIRIHTIGVGGTRKLTVLPDGRRYVSDPSRDMDEAMLQAVATSTGGQYFRARDPAQMATIYQLINELEPVPEEEILRPQRSLYHWPLTGALLCALPMISFGMRFQA